MSLKPGWAIEQDPVSKSEQQKMYSPANDFLVKSGSKLGEIF
jgi:hypothetical protein